MNENSGMIATETLRLLKKEYNKSLRLLYILLIGVMVLLIVSVVDSIYQRCRIIDILEEYEKDCVQEISEYHQK